jgi:hypothetical protein
MKNLDRRPPIAPEHHTVEHRLFYHMDDARVALMSFRDVLEANDPVLIPIFERLKEDYRTGSLAQSEMDAQMSRVRNRPGLTWTDEELQALPSYQPERLRAARATEAGAEIILRAADDVLSSVVIAFTGKDSPLDVGPNVGSEKVDRLLDAVGNYMRHRQEWRFFQAAGKAFTKQQSASILPLGRALSGDSTISVDLAFMTIVDEPFPLLRILDMLSGYSSLTGSGSYDILKENVIECAKLIIDREFPKWWGKRRPVLLAAENVVPPADPVL